MNQETGGKGMKPKSWFWKEGHSGERRKERGEMLLASLVGRRESWC